MVVRHPTVGKRAKRMPNITVETIWSLRHDHLVKTYSFNNKINKNRLTKAALAAKVNDQKVTKKWPINDQKKTMMMTNFVIFFIQ